MKKKLVIKTELKRRRMARKARSMRTVARMRNTYKFRQARLGGTLQMMGEMIKESEPSKGGWMSRLTWI